MPVTAAFPLILAGDSLSPDPVLPSLLNFGKTSLSLSTKHARNSSGDEIANVNFLYDEIVHILKNKKYALT